MKTEESASFEEIIKLIEELPVDDPRRVISNALRQIGSEDLEAWDIIVPDAETYQAHYRALVAVGHLDNGRKNVFCFFPAHTDSETLAGHYALCDALEKWRDADRPTRSEALELDNASHKTLVFAAHGHTADGEEILSIWHIPEIRWRAAMTLLKSVAKKYRSDVPSGN